MGAAVGLLALMLTTAAYPAPTRVDAQLETMQPTVPSLQVVAQVGGTVTFKDVRDGYAYFTVGPRVEIVDVSVGGEGRIVGRTDPIPEGIFALAMARPYIYLTTHRHSLYVLDAADLRRPAIVAFVPLQDHGEPGGLDVWAYRDHVILRDKDTTRILDVRDPRQPQIVATTGPMPGRFVAGNLLYGSEDTCIVVTDISNLPNPVRVSDTACVPPELVPAVPSTGAGLHASSPFQVSGNRVFGYIHWYAVNYYGRNNLLGSGIEVFDFSDPQLPLDISDGWRESRAGYGPLRLDERLMIIGSTVLDVSDPRHPRDLGRLPGDGAFPTPWLDALGDGRGFFYGRIRGCSGSFGLQSVDLRYLALPPVKIACADALWPSRDYVDRVSVGSGLVFASLRVFDDDYLSNLRVFDASDPELRTEVARIGGMDSGNSSERLALIQQQPFYVFSGPSVGPRGGSSTSGSLYLADTKNPLALGNLVLRGEAAALTNLSVTDRHVYSGYIDWPSETPTAGVLITDISDLAHPHSVAYIPTSSRDTERGRPPSPVVIVEGNYVYAVDRDVLSVIDATDPTAPDLVSALGVPTVWREQLTVQDGYLYIPNAENWGVTVVDVHNPLQPFVAASFEPGLPARSRSSADEEQMGIVVKGRYVFLAALSQGLLVVDCADPSAPVLVGRFDTIGNTTGVAVDGADVYVASGNAGLWKLRFPDLVAGGL
jgi:hypothetical protein